MNKYLKGKDKSSVYFKKVHELLKVLEDENEEDEYKNNDELYISFDYADLSRKGYFYKYKNQSYATGLRDARANRTNWVRFEQILPAFDELKNNYLKYKNIDPNLIEILYNEKGEKAVYDYIEQYSKGNKANKKVLPFKLKYNLTSVWDNKKLSLMNKIKITKMVKKNKNVSDVEFKTKFGMRLATAMAAVALIFSGVQKLGSSVVKEEKKVKSDNYNVMVDTIDEKEIDKVQETTHEKQSYKLSKEEKSRVLSQTQEFLEKRRTKNASETKEVELGSLINLPKGLQFSEGVSGGKIGTIGDESSPVDGVYVIDYFAEVSENGITSMHGLEGKINYANENSNKYVHISFVKGVNTIEEAKEIIEHEKQNVETGSVDTSKIQPRGWVSKDTIQQFYNVQQKNGKNQNQEMQR